VAEGAGLEHFALLGMSQAGAVAIAYAARNPARIESLILYGAYSKGARRRSLSPEALEENDLFLQLMRVGWGRANPAFGRIFTAELIPNASDEQARGLDTLQRSSTDGETAARMAAARSEIDVTELAKSIAVPTLILHARDDEAVAFEEGRRLASLIPGARMVVLEGRNHILLDDEPAWTQFIQELASFAGARRPLPAVEAIAGKLSRREVEVLQIASQGKSNKEIAAELGLSVRTIERHLGNIYVKLELSGKSARAGAVARLPRHNA
jgi:pimeloyl-ACP methyl ester carboxylesterase/DNA-binding CsgD family transcriptional regulator